MSDRLEAIRNRAKEPKGLMHKSLHQAMTDRIELLAEVDRLRAGIETHRDAHDSAAAHVGHGLPPLVYRWDYALWALVDGNDDD